MLLIEKLILWIEKNLLPFWTKMIRFYSPFLSNNKWILLVKYIKTKGIFLDGLLFSITDLFSENQ